MTLKRFRHRRLSNGNAKRARSGKNRNPIQKRSHNQKSRVIHLGFVGSTLGASVKLETMHGTWQRSPVGCINWCDSLPTGLDFQLSRSAADAAQENRFSLLTVYQIYCSITRKKPKDSAAPHAAKWWGCGCKNFDC